MIGIDIVDIEKFKQKNNIKKVFTTDELEYSSNKTRPEETLAGIYALKEAVIKAYGLKLVDILRQNIVISYENNKPIVFLNGNKLSCDASISHDGGYAIGVCYEKEKKIVSIDSYIAKLLPKRKQDSHKGDYGRIAILGGSEGMAGSVYMSSLSAMRTGAGLTYIICPESIAGVLQIKANEQIINKILCNNFYYSENMLEEILEKLENKDVVAIGPGMGKGENLNKLIGAIINKTNIDMVIDADGLNAASEDLSILKSSNNIILTPHLGEFARLTGLSIEGINKNREEIAKNFAIENNVILVLKSNHTLVTDGHKIYVNKIGNAGMATAGSGDVLTGIIASLMKRINPYDAAVLGVYLHSLAGDLAADQIGEDSLIATDIINYIPDAIKLLR